MTERSFGEVLQDILEARDETSGDTTMNNSREKDARGGSSVSELPMGWVETELGKIGIWSSGGTPSRKKIEYYQGSIPWVKTGDLNNQFIYQENVEEFITEEGLKYSSAKIFPAGTLLIAMYGATIGKVGILKVNAATNQACAALIGEGTTKDLIPFVKHFLCYRSEQLKLIGKGGAQPNINQAIIKSFPIPLPPLNEQRRIVAKLDSLFARSRNARQELERIPQLLQSYKQAVLQAAISGAMTQEWRENQKLPQLEKAKLSELASDFSYGSSAKSNSSGIVPVLRMGNIQDGFIDWSDIVYTSDPLEIEKYKLKKGDVLFNRTNSPELVGKTALYKGERDAIYAGYLIRVRCSSKLLPGFLNYALNSPIGRSYCWQVKTDGVSQSNINAKKLSAFTFNLPCLEEQKEIVKRVEKIFKAIDSIEQEYQKAVNLLDKLEQATLAKAFRGELVPQDPNDEPASVLLERIQAEKQEEPKGKTAKSKRQGKREK